MTDTTRTFERGDNVRLTVTARFGTVDSILPDGFVSVSVPGVGLVRSRPDEVEHLSAADDPDGEIAGNLTFECERCGECFPLEVCNNGGEDGSELYCDSCHEDADDTHEVDPTVACPACDGTTVRYLGAYNVECAECQHTWNERERFALSPTNCEACGHSLTWGCGHDADDERKAIAHRNTTEHLLGDCECYESRPGYAAFVSRDERREQVADIVRHLVPAARAVYLPGEHGGLGVPSMVALKAVGDALPTGTGWPA